MPTLDTSPIGFDVAQTSFASGAHRLAWYLGASLAPFVEVIPDGWPAARRDALLAGERALHAFFADLYADLYQQPAAYGLAETPDLVYEDHEWAKERPEVNRAKARNAHAIKALEALFDLVGLAQWDGDRLTVSRAAAEALLADLRPKSISRPRLKALWQALGRQGLTISWGEALVISSQPPELLLALQALCAQVTAASRALRLFAFLRCDLRALQPDYAPGLPLVLSVLPPDTRPQAEALIGHLAAAGYRQEFAPNSYPAASWALLFSGNERLKAGPLARLGFSYEYRRRFFAELHCANPRYLAPLAVARGPEYAAWFSSQWHQECTGCGYCQRFSEPGPLVVELAGRKRALCHANWLRMRDPDAAQTANFLRMVELHTEAGLAR
jgi:hypothetical protein